MEIQRTVHAGRYSDGRATPGREPYDIAAGEHSIFEPYLNAIKAAQRSIDIENQAIGVEAIFAGLAEALNRGVEVVVLVPAGPGIYVRAYRRKPEHEAFFDLLASLGRHEQFALVGIPVPGVEGGRDDDDRADSQRRSQRRVAQNLPEPPVHPARPASASVKASKIHPAGLAAGQILAIQQTTQRTATTLPPSSPLRPNRPHRRA